MQLLIVVTIACWLLSKRVNKTNWILFINYILVVILTVVFINAPMILLNASGFAKCTNTLLFKMFGVA